MKDYEFQRIKNFYKKKQQKEDEVVLAKFLFELKQKHQEQNLRKREALKKQLKQLEL